MSVPPMQLAHDAALPGAAGGVPFHTAARAHEAAPIATSSFHIQGDRQHAPG
jgi:hypothetical protein